MSGGTPAWGPTAATVHVDGCRDCGRPPTTLCPRCGAALCDAHQVDHESFREAYGRCYFNLARDNSALRGSSR